MLRKNARNILDSLSSGVILLDDSLLIVDINPAAENILGISRARARGQSLLQLVDDEPELREILSRVIATGDHYATKCTLHRQRFIRMTESSTVVCLLSNWKMRFCSLRLLMSQGATRSVVKTP